MANCKCPEGSPIVPCRRIVVFNLDESESESPCPCILPKAVDASKGLAVILNGRKSEAESLRELSSLEERCSQQNLITCVNPSGQRPYHYSLLINGASSVYVINCTGAAEGDELKGRVEQILSMIAKAYGEPTCNGVKSFVYILRNVASKKKFRISKTMMPTNVEVAECITPEDLKARLMESANEMLNTPDDDLTTPAGLTDMHRLEVNDGDQLRKLGNLLSVKATLDKKMRILRLLFDFGAVLYNIREEASSDLLIANSSYLYQMLSDARKKHNRIRGVVNLKSIGSEESYDNILVQDHHDQIGELLSELDLVLKVDEKQYVFIHTLPLSSEALIPCTTTDPLLVVYKKHGSSGYYPAGVNVLMALVQAFAKHPGFKLDSLSQGRYYLRCRNYVAGILCIWLEPQKPIMIAFRQGEGTFRDVQTLPFRIHEKCNEIYGILKDETSNIDDQLRIVFECDIHSSCVAKFNLVGGDCNLRCLSNDNPLCSTAVPWKKRIWHDCPDNKTLTVKFIKFCGKLKDVDDTHHSDSGPLNGRKRPAATSGTTTAKNLKPDPDLAGRPSTEDLKSISCAAGRKRKDLLRSLGIKEATIETLHDDNPNHVEEALYQGLLIWENEEALTPVTRGTLIDALKKVKLIKPANDLLHKVKSGQLS